MKFLYFVILLFSLFHVQFTCLCSDSQGCSNSVPYIGISSTSACITGYSLLRFMMPDKKAREQAPYIYCIGKGLLACGAATSAISSAFALQGLIKAAHVDSQVDSKYIDAAGAALPIGYLLSTIGECLVNKAHMIAHDDTLRERVINDVQAGLLPRARVRDDVV